MSSIVHHLKASDKFQLEIQSGNWGQNLSFLSRVTLKFEGWHWKTIGHLFYATSSFVHHVRIICEFKLELQSGKAQFGSKLSIFCPVWAWNLTDDIENATSSFVHHFIAICEFKLESQSGNFQIGFSPLWLWPLTSNLYLFSLLSLVITPENFKMIQWWEHNEKGVTGGWMDGQIEVFLELLGHS